MFWDLYQRIVVSETLRRHTGQLLRQRPPSSLQTLRRPWCQLLRERQSSLLYSHFRSTIRRRTIATSDLWSSGELDSRLPILENNRSVSKWRLALSSTNCSRREVVQEVPLGRGVAR